MAVTARKSQADDVTAEAVAHAIEFDILFGNARPRERLVEDELIQRFGAKRHVVRQALGELQQMGIVVRVPNRGAMVRDFTATEVEEIAEIREALHRQAAMRVALPADQELLLDLTRIQREHDEAVAARNPRKIDAANEAFHRTLFDACGNQQLSELIARYAHQSRAMRLYPMVDPDLLETLRQEHWAMIEALSTGDRDALIKLVSEHIQHSKKIYLEVRRSAGGEAASPPRPRR